MQVGIYQRQRLMPVLVVALGIAGCSKSDAKDDGAAETTGDVTTGDSTTTFTPTGTSSTPGDEGMSASATSTSGPADDDGGFISPPDGGVEGQCDPTAQDCPEGEKCTAYGSVEGEPWNANKCVPVTGQGQLGDPCDIEGGKYTGVDNCDVGLVCLLTDDDGKGGACVEFCDAQGQCPQSGGQCATYNDGSLPICLVDCDPLIQDCPDGQGCYASAATNAFVCFKYSGENGEGAPGDPCNYLNQCQPGTACLAPDAVQGCGAQAGCCNPFCDLGDPDPAANCNDTEDCVAFFENPPPGYVDVGVCSLP